MRLTTDSSALLGILLGIGALQFLPSVEAAFAQCVAGWDWSYNTELQNPCEIAGSLQAPCLGFSTYELGPLANGTDYVTPQQNDTAQKNCGCNTIIYSLYAACTLCQRGENNSTVTWAAWSQFCDKVFVTQYPFSIPYNASVPHWAYVNYTDSTFDVVRAQAAGRDPEATPSAPSIVSLTSTSSTRGLSTVQPAGTGGSLVPASTGSSGSSKSNTGAIAGGVVGGVIALAGLAALAFWFFKRRGRGGDPSNSNILGPNQITFNPTPNQDQPKLYDPADPSTFPTPISGGDSYSGGGGNYTTNPYQSGRYHGAAEL